MNGSPFALKSPGYQCRGRSLTLMRSFSSTSVRWKMHAWFFFLLLLNPCRTFWTIPHWVANEGSKKDSPTKPYNNPGADWHPWLWGGSKRIGLCCYFYIGFPWKHVDFCCHLWVVGTVFFWCPILTEPNRATFVPSEASYKSHSWEGIRCWTFWLKHVFLTVFLRLSLLIENVMPRSIWMLFMDLVT